MVSQHDDGWRDDASSREQKRLRRTQVVHTARNAWAYGRGMVRRTHRHPFDGMLHDCHQEFDEEKRQDVVEMVVIAVDYDAACRRKMIETDHDWVRSYWARRPY